MKGHICPYCGSVPEVADSNIGMMDESTYCKVITLCRRFLYRHAPEVYLQYKDS